MNGVIFSFVATPALPAVYLQDKTKMLQWSEWKWNWSERGRGQGKYGKLCHISSLQHSSFGLHPAKPASRCRLRLAALLPYPWSGLRQAALRPTLSCGLPFSGFWCCALEQYLQCVIKFSETTRKHNFYMIPGDLYGSLKHPSRNFKRVYRREAFLQERCCWRNLYQGRHFACRWNHKLLK